MMDEMMSIKGLYTALIAATCFTLAASTMIAPKLSPEDYMMKTRETFVTQGGRGILVENCSKGLFRIIGEAWQEASLLT
jgi:hypothetical protein